LAGWRDETRHTTKNGWLRKTLCSESDGRFYERPALDGVILGGQTGPGAVPMHPAWVCQVRDDCAEAGVPFYFKGWGEWCYPEHMMDSTYEHLDLSGEIVEGAKPHPFCVGRPARGPKELKGE